MAPVPYIRYYDENKSAGRCSISMQAIFEDEYLRAEPLSPAHGEKLIKALAAQGKHAQADQIRERMKHRN